MDRAGQKEGQQFFVGQVFAGAEQNRGGERGPLPSHVIPQQLFAAGANRLQRASRTPRAGWLNDRDAVRRASDERCQAAIGPGQRGKIKFARVHRRVGPAELGEDLDFVAGRNGHEIAVDNELAAAIRREPLGAIADAANLDCKATALAAGNRAEGRWPRRGQCFRRRQDDGRHARRRRLEASVTTDVIAGKMTPA